MARTLNLRFPTLNHMIPTIFSIISTTITFMKRLSIQESSSNEERINNPPSITALPVESHTDMEAGKETLPNEEEWKQTREFAQAISLGGVGASITLIVNVPSTAADRRSLYTGYIVAACLGLVAALGLAFYSIGKKRNSREVAWIQQRLMFFTLAFVAMACLLRTVFVLSFEYIVFGLLSIFTGVILVVFCLCVAQDCKRWGDADVAVEV